MSGYHRYVFDTTERKFVGNFEQMYKNESSQGYDSWHQEDQRQIHRVFDLVLLRDYNFDTIIDIGCGKGSFTHQLKKKNNRVIGIDISETAIQTARERYPDVEFAAVDLAVPSNFIEISEKIVGNAKIDLVLACEVLSYIENWRDLVAAVADRAEFLLLNLFIPEDAIGFVKSEQELMYELEKHFEVIEWITVRNRRFTLFFGRSRK
ncbi:trans-aconitate 2-methyltransferase [Geobacter sp. DSM 9736]|uniref:class I SAM-dependent methyltransferase n=1 Tax=Geobacter sp. DSM 9736 TaxID=1277350 RepID=UPI000B506B9F|nr:class I SAM-dependent methyltransferase [Geobacter sp. DSM 9736]SNB47011.1 Methyltransferase domain-containing protein [Geobacter sp. DSM 9736]